MRRNVEEEKSENDEAMTDNPTTIRVPRCLRGEYKKKQLQLLLYHHF